MIQNLNKIIKCFLISFFFFLTTKMMQFSESYPKSRIFKFVDVIPFDDALRRLAAFSLPSADIEAFITGISSAFPSVQQRLISDLQPKVFDRLTAEDIKVCIAFASRENLQKRCRLPLYGIVNDLLIAPQNRSPEAVAAVGPYVRLLIIALKKLEQEEVEASFAVPVETNPAAAAYVDEAVRSQGKIFSLRASVNFWGLATWTTMESLGDLLHFDRPSSNHLVFQCRHFRGVDLAKFEELPRGDSLYAKANIIGYKEMLVAVPPAMFSVVSHNTYAGTPNKLVVQLKIESSSIFDYLGEADAATTLGSMEQKKKESETRDYVARAFASVGASAANTKPRSLNLADVPQWMMEKLSGLPDEAKGILLKENIDDEQVFLSLGEADFEKIGFSLGHRKKLLQVSDEIKRENAAAAEAERRRIQQEQIASLMATSKLQSGEHGDVLFVENQNQNQQQKQNQIQSPQNNINNNHNNNDASSPPARSPFPSLLKPSIVGSDGTNINNEVFAQPPVPLFLQNNNNNNNYNPGTTNLDFNSTSRQNGVGGGEERGRERTHSEFSAAGGTSVFSAVSAQNRGTVIGNATSGVVNKSGETGSTDDNSSCYTIPTQDLLNEGNLPPNHPPHARVLKNPLPPPPPPQPPQLQQPQPNFLQNGNFANNNNNQNAAMPPVPDFFLNQQQQQQAPPQIPIPFMNQNNNNMNQQHQQQVPPTTTTVIAPVAPQFFQQQQQQPQPFYQNQNQQRPPVPVVINQSAPVVPQFLQQSTAPVPDWMNNQNGTSIVNSAPQLPATKTDFNNTNPTAPHLPPIQQQNQMLNNNNNNFMFPVPTSNNNNNTSSNVPNTFHQFNHPQPQQQQQTGNFNNPVMPSATFLAQPNFLSQPQQPMPPPPPPPVVMNFGNAPPPVVNQNQNAGFYGQQIQPQQFAPAREW
jgi:hypothetical protein